MRVLNFFFWSIKSCLFWGFAAVNIAPKESQTEDFSVLAKGFAELDDAAVEE